MNYARRIALGFKTLEELFYAMMGLQYPVAPLLIAEHRWHISGIETPVNDTSFSKYWRTRMNTRA